MAWQVFNANDGSYEVNWDIVTMIIRSHVRAESISRNNQKVVDKHSWNPFLPDVITYEVNWDKVREETRFESETRLQRFYAAAQYSMRDQIRQLHDMTGITQTLTDRFLGKQKEAQHQTMQNIESSVRNGEITVEALTILRDTCAEFDMVAATVFSGGLAAGVVGTAGGSLVKGVASYTETSKLGSAFATFGANFVVGILDVGVAGKLDKLHKLGKISHLEKFGYELVWAKAQGALEVPKALMEGKGLQHAASSGAVKLGSSTLSMGLDYWLKSNKRLARFSFPVTVALNVLKDRTAEYLGHSKFEGSRAPMVLHPHVERCLDTCVVHRSRVEEMAVRPLYSSAAW